MTQNRRFTRSKLSNPIIPFDQNHNNKQQSQLRIKINQAIQSKNLNTALSLLKTSSQKYHWASCTRARILFQQGSIKRSLSTIRNLLKNQQILCHICFQLLLNIINKSRPKIHKFIHDIDTCLNSIHLPHQFKSQFQSLKSQIINIYPHSQPLTSNNQFQSLTAYYQNKGLIFKKVQIVQVTKQYRIARAKSTIKPHQIIIFVPEKQMITLEIAKNLPEINKLAQQQSRLKSPKHCMLSIFLLLHMNKTYNSPYYNYIQCFPKLLQNFPIYYPQQLLQELQGTYFLNILKKKKQQIQQDYKTILLIAPQLKPQITYQKFIWSRMIVSSRIFGVIINGYKTDALVPIADMLNHKTPKLTSWYFSDQKHGFVVQNADQQILKGQEIFDSYGSKCNSRFLLNYGFTMPENSFNEVMIILKRHRNSKLIPPTIKLRTCLNSDQFRLILAYYRQIITQNTELQSNQKINNKISNFISNINQYQTWHMIQQTMKQQLQSYKTTIKKDQKILRTSHQLQFNYRNCIQIRLGQKKILDFYIKMSKKMIDFFSKKRTSTDVNQYQNYMENLLKNGYTTNE